MKTAFASIIVFSAALASIAGAQRSDAARVGASLPSIPIEYRSAQPQLFTVSHKRQVHILVGMASGLIVGMSAMTIDSNRQAKRCHSESCEVTAGEGLAIGIVGLGGAAIGGVLGALWPTH